MIMIMIEWDTVQIVSGNNNLPVQAKYGGFSP